jgi:hypothetical protein
MAKTVLFPAHTYAWLNISQTHVIARFGSNPSSPAIGSHMFPCRVIGRELFFVLIVYAHILPVKQGTVLAYRADFDAESAG